MTQIFHLLVFLYTMQEGEQADTSQQGGKAPKNPITGEPLTPVQNKDKEGYQATVLAGQSDETRARIMKQLDGQDGRPFGGGCCAHAGVPSYVCLLALAFGLFVLKLASVLRWRSNHGSDNCFGYITV